MRIGVPRERKDHEYRVALTPSGVAELTGDGHEVVVESGAGLGSSISDEDYTAMGATIAPGAAGAWNDAELVVKVKEPIDDEYDFLRDDLTLFAYLHLAADEPLTGALIDSRAVSVAFETVRDERGGLPLLAPMSEIAGRLSTQVGFYHSLRAYGGRGVLPGGVPGTDPATVTVIGGGVAGLNAARVAAGMGADVAVFDIDEYRLRAIDESFGPGIRTRYSHARDLEQRALESDLVIGAVLIPGAKAPELIDRSVIDEMRTGAVLVDISIDQGGCFADSRPTTYTEPTYTVGDTIFYCVANMPGAVPATSTPALENATLRYIRRIAADGWRQACAEDPGLADGLHTIDGHLVNEAVARAHGREAGRLAEFVT